MYTIKFIAHNAPKKSLSTAKSVTTTDEETTYQLICALNFTGFTFVVIHTTVEAGGPQTRDVTDMFEERMSKDTSLPVTQVAGF